MPRKPKVEHAPPAAVDLKNRHVDGPLTSDMKRFDIFLIDSGWNTPVSQLVRSQLPLIYEYQSQDSLYILTPEQSVEILKHAPEFIGHDPTIVVYDLFASQERKHRTYRGFRLNLGRFKSAEQALSRLQEFLRFIIQHRTALSLDSEVRRELHREGVQGMIQVLRDAKTELL
jgi:hypothetical protein